MKNRLVHWFVIIIMTLLYFGVSIISTIHVVDFFLMTNSIGLAISLAVGFELGAAASLASITVLEKTNKPLVWTLFIVLTLFQAMGNMYSTYVSAHDYQGFVELFGLTDFSVISQKRILALLSGAILPLVALGYIKSLVDYIRPSDPVEKKLKKKDDFDSMFETKPKKKDKVKNGHEEYTKIVEEVLDEVEKEEENIIKVEPTLKESPDDSSQQKESVKNEESIDITNTNPKQNNRKKNHITTTKKNPKT